MEEGLQEEELARRDPPRPVQCGLGAEGTAVLAAATRAACPGARCPALHPVMTLCPSLLPLRWLLLLISGAVCRADAGFETESPIRTLQVETLVRRRQSQAPRGRALSGADRGLSELGAGRRGSAGTELRDTGCRGQNGIFGGASVTPAVRS